MTDRAPPSSLAEIAAVFLKLGLTSFGGPVAHLGYFHAELVRRRRWLDEADYVDLVALCNFLPGPASSQLVFAIGMRRGGLLGAFAASLCFTLPSAILLILFAFGVAKVGDLRAAGWLHGLKLAAVAVVAQAVWNLGRKLCPDRARITLALVAAAAVLILPNAAIQVAVIAGGALAGWWIYRRDVRTTAEATTGIARHHAWAAATLATFLVLLFLLPAVAVQTHSQPLAVFDSFYRAGSLVFGGGHVVLPLLRAEVVPPGWITDDAFLAGYGAAQAVPGPLFTFSAYLGAVIFSDAHPWLGGFWCLLGIFLPAWMLIGGALPFWHLLRSKAWTQAGLRGANAAVVGVLLAALYNPVWLQGVHHARDVAAAFAAFALLEIWRAPPWLVVVLAAMAGQWLL
ncbi:chromate efflux transporter [Opitutus terrae]|uniref:Chromate transporter, chromate ion transporter (CHR) family n=1 Tax=Opitutus terrae (strain DSM 11246 / JCM 15787 / PB90-1) TaxID=452637 RepID=B1ZNT5_OPITP|nr:chromate efflux transporter [Opitutus terrae]ACB75455.1 chromate transporter, chromate ion transporter (CHR) family [Opitutus terrae PB90-1]